MNNTGVQKNDSHRIFTLSAITVNYATQNKFNKEILNKQITLIKCIRYNLQHER